MVFVLGSNGGFAASQNRFSDSSNENREIFLVTSDMKLNRLKVNEQLSSRKALSNVHLIRLGTSRQGHTAKQWLFVGSLKRYRGSGVNLILRNSEIKLQ